jgi:hypothetical protein
VSTQSNCPQTTKASKVNNNDLIYCADGREAFDFEECKPVFECETGHRCEDGSCRDEPSYCPRANTCPNGQKRCKNGACVADESECAELQKRVLERLLDAAYLSVSENPYFCAFVDMQGLGRDDRLVPEIILKVYNNARCHLLPDEWLDKCISAFIMQHIHFI